MYSKRLIIEWSIEYTELNYETIVYSFIRYSILCYSIVYHQLNYNICVVVLVNKTPTIY